MINARPEPRLRIAMTAAGALPPRSPSNALLHKIPDTIAIIPNTVQKVVSFAVSAPSSRRSASTKVMYDMKPTPKQKYEPRVQPTDRSRQSLSLSEGVGSVILLEP